MWEDFPRRANLGNNDTGIDSVAIHDSGEYRAFYCRIHIEGILECYVTTKNSKSLIINNPNDWSREHENPTYIFDLLLSVINLSVQTVDIINNLPKLVL